MRSQAHPLPTYIWGEKQRTCLYGRIWNISDRAGTNPEGLLQHFRVDIDTRVGKNRRFLTRDLDLKSPTYKVSRWSREPPVHSQTVPDSSPER